MDFFFFAHLGVQLHYTIYLKIKNHQENFLKDR